MLGDAEKVDVLLDWSESIQASTRALVGERGFDTKASQLRSRKSLKRTNSDHTRWHTMRVLLMSTMRVLLTSTVHTFYSNE